MNVNNTFGGRFKRPLIGSTPSPGNLQQGNKALAKSADQLDQFVRSTPAPKSPQFGASRPRSSSPRSRSISPSKRLLDDLAPWEKKLEDACPQKTPKEYNAAFWEVWKREERLADRRMEKAKGQKKG